MSDHMQWWVEYFDRHNGWCKFPAPGHAGNPVYRVEGRSGRGWTLEHPFSEAEHAIEAIECRREQTPSWCSVHHRVANELTGEVAWDSQGTLITTPQEESSMGFAEKEPLHVKRTDLIEALQKRLGEEQQKRADAEKAQADARKAAVEAVSKFSGDQLTNIVTEYLRCVSGDSSNGAIVKWAEEKQESKAFVTKELKVTATETAIEKYVRVLELASDEQIEVAPSDDVYPLL